MKIWSIKKGFTSDHSSTSYEFLAVDKPLSKTDKDKISMLSRRVSPTSYRSSFVYNVDGYDIPGGWENLMKNYYDVMYSVDYDWWTLAIAFNTTKEQFKKLKEFEFRGHEDLGIDIEGDEKRVIITIYCVIDDDECYDIESEYSTASRKSGRDNGLLNFLAEIRELLIKGDYRALYAVWDEYYVDEAEDSDVERPEEPEVYDEDDKGIIEDFKNLLTCV
ncbi:MAG: hypothetical protein FWC47_08990 [Oscillospiraceae bacterium]|nr:hypothetical protein [Oscillospiraceae bacterium]